MTFLRNRATWARSSWGCGLGGPKFYEYIRAFGIGSQTGVELPGEQRGILASGDLSSSSIASISMGQEVAVTAVQLISAMNTIANGGLWVRPRVIRSVGNLAPVTPVKFQESRRVISATTAATMRAMLEGVVLPGGTGKKARLDGYTAAGKPGTAQKAGSGYQTVFDIAVHRVIRRVRSDQQSCGYDSRHARFAGWAARRRSGVGTSFQDCSGTNTRVFERAAG